MKQFVFLKQVPSSTKVHTDPITHTLVRSGSRVCTNPDDLRALQAAVDIKKQLGGEIIAITMGPPQAKAVLREALMLGADEGVLVSDPAFAGSDTWSTSYILASVVQKMGGATLLLFGKQAIDGDTAQVGPGVAARLNIPQLTEVHRVMKINEREITIEKITDIGIQTLQTSLPCILTITRKTNNVHIPSLRDWEESLKKKITHISLRDLSLDASFVGLAGSPTRVVKVEIPSGNKKIQWISDMKILANILTNNKI